MVSVGSVRSCSRLAIISCSTGRVHSSATRRAGRGTLRSPVRKAVAQGRHQAPGNRATLRCAIPAREREASDVMYCKLRADSPRALGLMSADRRLITRAPQPGVHCRATISCQICHLASTRTLLTARAGGAAWPRGPV
jgi:hypothetical protein